MRSASHREAAVLKGPVKVGQPRIASLLECRWLLRDKCVARDAGLHCAADTGETKEHRPREVVWQRGTPIGVVAKEQNDRAPGQLRKLIDRGVKSGHFRADLDPIEVHMSISALAFYNVSNRYTFSTIFGRDMTSPKAVASRRETVADIISRWCQAKP